MIEEGILNQYLCLSDALMHQVIAMISIQSVVEIIAKTIFMFASMSVNYHPLSSDLNRRLF